MLTVIFRVIQDIQRIWLLHQPGRQESLVSFGNTIHARRGMKAPLSLRTGNDFSAKISPD